MNYKNYAIIGVNIDWYISNKETSTFD